LANTDQGGRRQVTLVEQEIWHTLMARVGVSLPPIDTPRRGISTTAWAGGNAGKCRSSAATIGFTPLLTTCIDPFPTPDYTQLAA
jgi:hypothetical protein